MGKKQPHNESGVVHTQSKSYSKVPIDLTHDLRLTDGAVRLYAHMRWRYGHDQNNFEGRARMSKQLGVSEATITKRIKELEAAGWVVTVERRRPDTMAQETNVYHVFEVQGDAERFRREYKPDDFEFVHPRPTVEPRKSRKGIGGKPSHVNSSLDGQPEKLELTPPLNSSSQDLDAVDLDAKDSLADANAPQGTPLQEQPDPPQDDPPKKKKRAQDPVFEALCEMANGVPYAEASKGQVSYTRAIMREVKAHADLKDKPPTPEEVSTLRKRFAAECPGLTFPDDPRKVAKWLADLRTTTTATPSTRRYLNGSTRAELVAALEAQPEAAA